MRKRQGIVDVVVPFKHILVVVLNNVSGEPPYQWVCSTLELAKKTLANYSGMGSIEAWGIDSVDRMVLWGKSLGWRRCPVKHLEQIETEYVLNRYGLADATTYPGEP